MASETTSSKRVQTALALIEAYNNSSLADVMAVHADNCIHQVLPKSLNFAPMDNAAYSIYFENEFKPLFRRFSVTVDDVTEDERRNRVVLRASSVGETDVEPFLGEYVVLLEFTPDGGKVTRVDEFVDSAAIAAFMSRVKKYHEDKGKGADGGA